MMPRTTRTIRIALAGLALAAVLTGCTAQGAPAPSAPPETEASPLDALEHVHEIAFRGETVLIASHQGVYSVVPADGQLELVGDTAFDAMGMAATDAGTLASGHPGAHTDEVFVGPNLGLISSDGGGWESVALSGEVDFHALTAAADRSVIAGLPSGDTTVLTSVDLGQTGERGATLEARDLVYVSGDLIATTAEGPVRSEDRGMTFEPIEGAPLLVIVAANPSGELVGVDATGAIVHSGGAEWTTVGQASGSAVAIAVDQDGTIALVDDRGLVISSDGGATWEPVALTM